MHLLFIFSADFQMDSMQKTATQCEGKAAVFCRIHRKMNGGYRYDESDHIGGCKNRHVRSRDRAAENFARCRGLSATGRTIHGCRQCLSAGCCRYGKHHETAYRYGRIKQNLLPYKSRTVFHSDETVKTSDTLPPRNTPDSFCRLLHPTKSSLRCASQTRSHPKPCLKRTRRNCVNLTQFLLVS